MSDAADAIYNQPKLTPAEWHLAHGLSYLAEYGTAAAADGEAGADARAMPFVVGLYASIEPAARPSSRRLSSMLRPLAIEAEREDWAERRKRAA